MADGELPTRERDEISKVGPVADVRDQRAVFVIHRLPVRTVHLRVIEVIALRAPGFLEDLRPLGAWIDEHLELADVDGAVAHLGRLVGGDDAPATLRRAARGLIQQLLPVAGERIRTNTLENRRRHALLELVALKTRRTPGVRHRLEIKECSGGAGAQVAELAGRNA